MQADPGKGFLAGLLQLTYLGPCLCVGNTPGQPRAVHIDAAVDCTPARPAGDWLRAGGGSSISGRVAGRSVSGMSRNDGIHQPPVAVPDCEASVMLRALACWLTWELMSAEVIGVSGSDPGYAAGVGALVSTRRDCVLSRSPQGAN